MSRLLEAPRRRTPPSVRAKKEALLLTMARGAGVAIALIPLFLVALQRGLAERRRPKGGIRSGEEKLERRIAAGTLGVADEVGRLRLFSEITQAIGERHDVQSIFAVVTRTLETQLPLEFCCVCLHDAASQRVTIAHIGQGSQSFALKLGLTLQGEVEAASEELSGCLAGRFIYEPDARENRLRFAQRFARVGLHAVVAAPLVAEGKAFGILVAARVRADSFTKVCMGRFSGTRLRSRSRVLQARAPWYACPLL